MDRVNEIPEAHQIFIETHIQSWPWPYVYNLRNQEEQVHHLYPVVTAWQGEAGNISRTAKLTTLYFKDKNILLWPLLNWNGFPGGNKDSQTYWSGSPCWAGLPTGRKHSANCHFLFSEAIQTVIRRCSPVCLSLPLALLRSLSVCHIY